MGVIGGSGLYDLPDLEGRQEVTVDTPFGARSGPIVRGRLGGRELAFLPRHGAKHTILPSEINFRANVWALKSIGVSQLLSVSAVGSMKESIHPGDIVFVDQFIDITKRRSSTFFGDGLVAHVPMADPVCRGVQGLLVDCARTLDLRHHVGGTYVCIEGPQFSTRGESLVYRGWGVDVVGMTNMPEAKLAREAEIAYATVALVTDYDCWHETEADVDVSAVIAVIRKNVDLARRVVGELAQLVASNPPISAAGCMQHAIMTAKEAIPPDARRRLDLLIGKYLG
ncbi:MAG: S-methyl-5'-thioadenosine phosphorylase [Planctomycetota bacterium]